MAEEYKQVDSKLSLNLHGLLCHNLAVTNYCEILDHNDRVMERLASGATHFKGDKSAMEAIQKSD